jgi:D-alanine-D-alanine ligase
MAPAPSSGNQDDADPLTTGGLVPNGHWSAPTRPLRVAVLHNSKTEAIRAALPADAPADALAELDSQLGVHDYVAALRALGHTVLALEGDIHLPQRLAEFAPDLCFNTCEGVRGDSREAQVPAMLEMLGIPYTAAKVLSLAVTLDKAMTKRVLAYHGLPTPHFQEFRHADEPLDPALAARLARGGALFVKPNREGTGKGIYKDALVRNAGDLRERVAYLLDAYRQSVLVEEYVTGRDVTCGLVGNFGPLGETDDLHLFPISEINYSGYPLGTEQFYSYKLKVDLAEDYAYWCPAPLSDALAAEVRRLTVETFRVCGCLDIARVDFRLDTENNLQPMILEINALPGLAYNSDLTLCAEADGWSHYDLLQRYFNAAVKRHGLAEPAALAVAA